GFAGPLPVESLEQGDEFRRIGRGDLSACRRLRHQGGLFVVRRTLNPLPRFTMSAAPNVAAIRCRRESAPWRVRATSRRLPPAVDLPLGEDARIGPEGERVTPDLEANLLRTTPRFRPRRKVVLAHFDGRTMDPA